MKVTLKHRDGSKKTWNTDSDNLYDSLLEILEKTWEEDDTGYFFDVENADDEYINKDYVIVLDKFLVGINLRDISIA